MSIVQDEATSEYIVKLVNMLPVEAKGNLDLSPLGVTASKVTGQILTGKPDDTLTTPVDVTVNLPEITLPPYSFTLFRLPTSK